MRFFCFIIFLTLTACHPVQPNPNWLKHHAPSKKSLTEKSVHDGAPKGPLPKHFENAKPIKQPLSRYGNPDSYAVEGKKYHVLRTAQGYKAKGIASWYGTKFHKKRTSSGDPYDMYAMTAAHKTLPLPSYVRVKNVRNGKEAIVKINDRGPFRSDRIIDLSYAAATKLGLLPTGTAVVEVESIGANGVKSRQLARYYIQVGAFSNRNTAVQMRARVRQFTALPVDVERYQKHFIVKVGPFDNKRRMEILKTKLESKGIKGAFAVLQ